jgi:hypothetical protein
MNNMISVCFRSEYGSLCGMLNFTISNSISRQTLLNILEIFQTQIDFPYKTFGLVNAPNIINILQNIAGESCIVRLDQNLEDYGVDEIKNILDNYSQKLVVFKGFDTHLAVPLEEEGSSSMIEEMLSEYISA